MPLIAAIVFLFVTYFAGAMIYGSFCELLNFLTYFLRRPK